MPSGLKRFAAPVRVAVKLYGVMWPSILLGSGYAFAAVLQPGPFQAYLFSSVTRHGWQRTLPAALAPLLSDGPIILIVLLVLTRLPDAAARFLQAAGGLLLLYLAWSSYRDWQRGPAADAEATGRTPRTLLEAAGINLLNPNPWIGWSLIMGPALVSAWRQAPANGIALLASFYGVLTLGTALLILLFGSSRFLSPALRHSLILVSAIILALLGLYRLGLSVAA